MLPSSEESAQDLEVNPQSMESSFTSSGNEVREESLFIYTVRWAITMIPSGKQVLEWKETSVKKSSMFVTEKGKSGLEVTNENQLKWARCSTVTKSPARSAR